MRPHFHLDIETLGIRPTSVILSIGVVEIDFEAGRIVREMHVNIDPDDCEFYGLTTDQSTIDWWAKQSDAAKARTFDKNTAHTLKMALTMLTGFMGDGPKEVSSYGISLDIMCLENAYRAVSMQPPWGYREVQDARTLFNWFPGVECSPRPVAAHDALVDATYQAEHLIRIYKHIEALYTPAVMIDASGSSPVTQAIASIHNYIESLPRAKRPAACEAVMNEWAVIRGREPRTVTTLADIMPAKAVVEDDEL